MMKKFLFLTSIITICMACKGQRLAQGEIRENYRERLEKVINSTDVTDHDIVFVIPTTSKEALMFFSTDFQKQTSSQFSELQSRILSLCQSGNKDAIGRFLYMSEFVDGYFAEDYFDNLEKIGNSQIELLCKQMNTLNQDKIRRLADFRHLRCPK